MRELVFDIFAIDRASAVFDRVAGRAEGAGKVIAGAFLGAGVAVAALAIEGIKTAGEMEAKMTKLTSTAGESSAGMQVAWNGIDAMAGQVGDSVQTLGDAMYYVESGSFHGAEGLKVLAAAAKGAKVENADVGLVAHTVTGALRDYGLGAKDAATVVNAMNTAVGHGLMTFNDLADAFPHVGARAKAANVTLAETVSALGRMTADGLPASVAATYLGQTIGQLAAPTAKARTEMKGLGINATELSQTLTSGSGHGLGDAIKMVYDGITKHLTPAGLVAVQTFGKSKGSASDYQKMLANLPPTMQTSFQALSVMSGGVKSMQGVLMLGQDGLKGYNQTLKDVNASIKRGGQDVDGFAKQQATFKGKVDDLKGAFSGLMDTIGRALLPVATQFVGWLADAARWMQSHAIPAAKELAGWLKDHLAAAFQFVSGWVKDHRQQLQAVADYITGTVVPIIKDFARNLWDGLVGAFNIVKGVINDHKEQLGIMGKALAVVGGVIVQYIVPILGVILKNAFMAVAWAVGAVITVLTDIVAAFQTVGHWGEWLWDNALKPTVQFILNGFKAVADMFASVLKALGNVPNFGWAKVAGDALQRGADEAGAFATSLNNIPRTVPVTVTFSYPTPLTPAGVAAQAQSGLFKVSGKNATGTSNWRGGLTWVGENGPELAQLPGGTQIFPADRSRQMAGSGGGPALHIENYYEQGNSAQSVASELMFRLRSA